MSTDKRITFYDQEGLLISNNLLHGYNETLLAINRNEPRIHTTQMALLDYSLFMKGYRIFIVSKNDNYEITMLNFDRMGGRGFTAKDDIFDLWRSGEFAKRSD